MKRTIVRCAVILVIAAAVGVAYHGRSYRPIEDHAKPWISTASATQHARTARRSRPEPPTNPEEGETPDDPYEACRQTLELIQDIVQNLWVISAHCAENPDAMQAWEEVLLASQSIWNNGKDADPELVGFAFTEFLHEVNVVGEGQTSLPIDERESTRTDQDPGQTPGWS